MNRLLVVFLIGLGLALPHFTAADAQTDALRDYQIRQQRALRARQQQYNRLRALYHRRRMAGRVPPWVHYKSANEKGEKAIQLEDMQLWNSMDLNKDGKLTIAEYERFSRSPNAQNFVRHMKEHKAVEQWAQKIGIDVQKAKAAMMLGANAQRRRMYLQRQHQARVMAIRRRQAIARRNQIAAYQARQRQQNFWARMGQQYYNAMKQSRGRRGGEL